MAEFSVSRTPRGQWFEARDDGNLVLSAHRTQETEDQLTVYWRGRTDAKLLVSFFFAAVFPPAKQARTSALFFTDAGRFRFDLPWPDIIPLPAVFAMNSLPNVDFLRLEYHTRDDESEPFDATLIVWSRLGLEHISRGESAPDNIGVYLGSAHLIEIRQRLAEFIDKTHIRPPSTDVVIDCLQSLSEHTHRTQPPPLAAR